jgi:hypothetical protein
MDATVLVAAVALAGTVGCRDNGTSQTPHARFYVAPTGTPQGDGSAARPWDLTTALAHPANLQPDDTIYVRGGTYTGSYISTLSGGAGHLVVLRTTPEERVIIDGSLEVRGQFAMYWGLEVTNSDPNRQSNEPGPSPSDYTRPVGVVVHGPGTKLVNMIVHDTRSGIGAWSSAVDAEVYGAIVYNNGWQGPDDGYGAGIMSQNKEGIKTFAENVVFQQYKGGVEIYGSSEADLVGFNLEGNVAFLNGMLSQRPIGWDIFVGGGKMADGIRASSNYTYRTDGHLSVRFGYDHATPNGEVTLTDNYFVGETEVINWNKATLTGNTFTGAQDLLIVRMLPTQQFGSYSWNKNTYMADTTIPTTGSDQPFQLLGPAASRAFDLVAWRKASGFDGSSRASRGRPTGTSVFVRPNKYEEGRAHIIVYNWDRLPEVEVDVSKALKDGDSYQVHSVQDLFGKPVAEGVYEAGIKLPFGSGSTIRIPMTAIPAAVPVGLEKSPAPSSGPEFGVFLLTKHQPGVPAGSTGAAGTPR